MHVLQICGSFLHICESPVPGLLLMAWRCAGAAPVVRFAAQVASSPERNYSLPVPVAAGGGVAPLRPSSASSRSVCRFSTLHPCQECQGRYSRKRMRALGVVRFRSPECPGDALWPCSPQLGSVLWTMIPEGRHGRRSQACCPRCGQFRAPQRSMELSDMPVLAQKYLQGLWGAQAPAQGHVS